MIRSHLGTKYQYSPQVVPVEGVVPPSWRDTVLEHQDGPIRIHRRSYELCVLRQLERAFKEIWVKGSYAFRNPSQDMPADWHLEEQRMAYCRLLPHPVDSTDLLDPRR